MRAVTVFIILTSLVLIFLAAVPQIGNGGFELATTPGAATIPDWPVVTAQDAQVLNSSGGDIGMPTEAQSWLTFSGLGSSNASRPSVINGFGNPPANVVSVAQSFSLSGNQTRLEMDAVFLSNETPGTLWVDFLSVDISDGVSSYNLLVLDINSPLPQTSQLYNQTLTGQGMKATSVAHISKNLPVIFPNADTTTVFTLTLSVGNAVDASLPSRAYFDGVKFTTGATIPVGVPAASVRIDPMANGDWLLTSEAPAWPGAIIYNIFSGNTSQPLGSGGFAGIVPDQSTYFTMNAPLGMPPFHVGLDSQGRYLFQIPAWAAPGVTADCFMAVFYAGILVEISPPIRHTF